MNVVAAVPADFAWLVERTSCAVTSQFRAIKAVDDSGRIRGMVGYDGWTINAVQAHMAVEAPMVWRSLLGPAFAYPFGECNRGLLLAAIPSHNTRSWGLALHFGFRVAHVVRDGWAVGDDLLLLELRREDCRFLKGN